MSARTATNRATHLQRGARAEQLAVDFLQRQGLRVIERNFRCTMGELDIVARGTGTPERHAGTVIVFVEVRYRSRADFGGAAASIDSRKQAKLLRAARAWIQQNDPREQFQYRFDVVTVAPGSSGQPAIDWLQAAISET